MSTEAIAAPASSAPAPAPAPSAPQAPAAPDSTAGGFADVGAEVDSWFSDESTTSASEPATPPAEGDSPEFLSAFEEVTGQADQAEPAVAEPAAEKKPAVAAPVPPPPDPQASALDENGVAVDAGGRKVMYFSEARAEHIVSQARVAQEIAQALGGVEALTPDMARELVTDSRTHIDLLERLTEPGERQQQAMQYLLSEAMAAYHHGVVNVDPSESLGTSFLAAAERSAPRVAESIKASVAKGVVADMYDRAKKAIGTGAEATALGLAQRLDMALNGKYITKADLLAAPKADDPGTVLSRREEDISRREAAIADAKLNAFRTELGNQRVQVTAAEIDKQLASVNEVLKRLPAEGASEFRNTLNVRLRQEISAQLKADTTFNENMNRLWEKAKNAGSDNYRGQLAQQMKNAYALRVQQVLRSSAPKIISALTAGFASSNAERHQQIAGSQRQVATAPVTAGQVPATLPPRTGNEYLNKDHTDAIIDKLFA